MDVRAGPLGADPTAKFIIASVFLASPCHQRAKSIYPTASETPRDRKQAMSTNEETLLLVQDQEAGGSLKTEADALKPVAPKKSWRRVGLAAGALSVLALGSVAAVKTASVKRGGSQPTNLVPYYDEYYPVSVEDHTNSGYHIYGKVNYYACSSDDYHLKPGKDLHNGYPTFTAKSLMSLVGSKERPDWCQVTEVSAWVRTPGGAVHATSYKKGWHTGGEFIGIAGLGTDASTFEIHLDHGKYKINQKY